MVKSSILRKSFLNQEKSILWQYRDTENLFGGNYFSITAYSATLLNCMGLIEALHYAK